jgi:hypothetical protein
MSNKHEILKNLNEEDLQEKLSWAQKHIDWMVSHRKFTIPQIRHSAHKIKDHLLSDPEEIVEKMIECLMEEEPIRIPKSFLNIKIPGYSSSAILHAAKKINIEHFKTPIQIAEQIISLLYRGK